MEYQALETVTVNEVIVHANMCKYVCKDTVTTDSILHTRTHTHTHTHTHKCTFTLSLMQSGLSATMVQRIFLFRS